jgi:hypothetical protein
VVLDPSGREIARRDQPGIKAPTRGHLGNMRVADLDGDGRDELLVWHSERLRALDCGLKELWTWPEEEWEEARGIVPPSRDRPAMVMTPSGVILDGRTGRPRWLAQLGAKWPHSRLEILDPGDPDRRPLLISHQQGPTVCRVGLPATSGGTFAPPRGRPVRPGLADGDPRWTRPLPWTEPIVRNVEPARCAAAVGLALVNVVVPLGILWIAARRRPWTIRLLMALPVAAAVPLAVFQTIEPLIPAQLGSQPFSSRVVFALGTLAGVPIVVLTLMAGWALVRRRWKQLALVAGWILAASALIAVAWLWRDSRVMPAIERYDRSHWWLVFVPGAYSVGVLAMIVWVCGRIVRGIVVRWNCPSRSVDAAPVGSTM